MGTGSIKFWYDGFMGKTMKDMKVYLGDGAYANFDGYHVVLTAENGIYATDTVALEPEVLNSFLGYIERLKQYLETKSKP